MISIQHGDDGTNAVFHVGDLEKAADYVNVYRRRQLSEQDRKALVDRLKKSRPSSPSREQFEAPKQLVMF